MATTTKRRGNVKCESDGEASEVVRDRLEELAQAGAREMLMSALGEEVNNYLVAVAWVVKRTWQRRCRGRPGAVWARTGGWKG